jgi:hypothetical protein
MKPETPLATDDNSMVRARVDAALKEQWEGWCKKTNITPSQALRWLLQMHLKDPSKLWAFLQELERDQSSQEGDGHA